MHPNQSAHRALDRIVEHIDCYPVDARMQRQMIERATSDGVSYADVVAEIRQIVSRSGADSTQTDCEIEVYLRRRTPRQPLGKMRKKSRQSASFDATVTVRR